MRQQIFKLAQTADQAVKLIKEGVLNDFILVYVSKNITPGYYLIKDIKPFVNIQSLNNSIFLDIVSEVYNNLSSYTNKAENTKYIEYIYPNDFEKLIQLGHYTSS